MSIIKINKKVAGFLSVAAMAFLFTAGCTANKTQPVTDPTASEDAAVPAESFIELVSVVRMGDAVLVEADGPLRFTSFRLSSPSRVIIDLPSVNVDKVQSSIDVDNEYITTITTSSYGDNEESIGRIEIGLRQDVDYEIKSGEDSLLVELNVYQAGSEEADAPLAEGPGLGAWDVNSAGDEVVIEDVTLSDDAASEQTSTEPAGEAAAKAASTIIDLKFNDEDGVTTVNIVTDGEVGNYNAFGLDDPTRVVVDIWGVDSSLYDDTVEVDSAILERVRLGTHDDKVRFVFDSSSAAVPYYSVDKNGDSLIITLSREPIEEPKDKIEQATVVSDVTEENSSGWSLPIEDAVEDATSEEVVEVVEEVAAEQTTAAEQVEVAEAEVVAEAEPAAAEAVEPEVLEVAEEAAETTDLEVIEESVASAPEVETDVAATEESFVDEAPYEPEPQEEVRSIKRAEAVDVQDVSFKLAGDVARLSVVSSDVAKFRLKESEDGKILNIDIFNAFIPDSLKSTLDAAELGTPVATISSYQAYTKPVGNVKIIVKLSDRVPYDIRRDGNAINIDFPLMTWVQKDKDAAKKAIDDGAVVIADADVLGIEDDTEDEEDSSTRYTGRKINIDMVDAEVTDMLKLLAEVSDLNIIASGEVSGKITLRLKDVPWDQAFDLILKTRGLASIQDGNVVRVAPASRIREEREAVLAAKKAATKLEDLKTEYIRINYDKAVSLSVQLETLLSDRGSITVHEPTNTVVVRDIGASIADVKSYIKKVDIPIQQVLIEARIVEATSSFARDLGVQWGIDFRSAGNQMTTSSFGSVDEQFGQWAVQPTQKTGTLVDGGSYNVEKKNFLADAGVTNYAVNLPASGTAGTLGALGFILGKTGANPMILDLRISAGEQKGLVKTISRPRIITMDNKEAKIEQGESIPFETSTVEGSATTFIDANLSLIVKPQITPDGSVLMEIKASRNSIGSFRNSAGEPSINRKEASTHVLVRNGETTVMGGIIVSDSNNSEKGIPFFKEIPVLGWLFKSKSITDSQTELLIFITPTILNMDGTQG